MTNDVAAEVRRVIQKRLDVAQDRVTLDASLIDLGADSLTMVDLLLDFEEEFNVEIPDDEALKILTEAIGAIEKLVLARASA
jgi:acyl carrier protein